MKVATVWVVCDSCGTQRQGVVGQTAAELRAAMAKYGTWSSRGERDLCSTCIGRGVQL